MNLNAADFYYAPTTKAIFDNKSIIFLGWREEIQTKRQNG